MGEIIRAVTEIEPQLCQKVSEHFNKSVNLCGAARGGCSSDIIFNI